MALLVASEKICSSTTRQTYPLRVCDVRSNSFRSCLVNNPTVQVDASRQLILAPTGSRIRRNVGIFWQPPNCIESEQNTKN
ncbi:hypothetical protein LB505_003529 [Fusarium chuoi]|nr:hypothetical protein LB505_003529 [Fusarium chuoi]